LETYTGICNTENGSSLPHIAKRLNRGQAGTFHFVVKRGKCAPAPSLNSGERKMAERNMEEEER